MSNLRRLLSCFGVTFFGGLRKQWPGRTGRLRIEALEDRLTPAPVIKWDTPYDFDISKTFALRRVVEARLDWLRPGEQVRVEASLQVGQNPPGPTIMGVGRAVPGDLFTLHSGGSQTKTFRASGPGEKIKVQIDNYDLDDFAHLKVQVRKRSNLAVIGPTIHPDGRLTYGYAIPSDTSPDWNGAYVRVGLYYRYTQGGKVKLHPINGSELSDQPGFRKEFELHIKNLPSPPTGTTEIVAAIDVEDKVPETDERDNQNSIKLPNLSVKAPGYRERGLFGERYEVRGTIPAVADSANSLRAELYYAKGDKLTDILGAPIAGGAVTATGGIILADPPPPPAGATHILYVVDRYNRVAETDETDNVRATLLPDLDVTGLEWDGKGGAVIKVKVTNATQLPPGVNPGVGLFWATGPAATDKVLLTTITLPRASIPRKDGEHTILIKPGTLATVSASLRDALKLSPVTHLIAAVLNADLIYESNESNNSESIALGQVSDELSDAPPAATGAERVRLWTRKYEPEFRKAAIAQNVDPRVIAGVIAWEALENNTTNPSGAVYGPGKIHWQGLVVEEVETLGLIVNPPINRAAYVRTPAGAAQYIAAILRGFSDVLVARGYNAASEQDGGAVLATLYQGRTIGEYAAWLDAQLAANPAYKPQPPQTPTDARGTRLMGYWFTRNLGTLSRPKYVDSLLASTFRPKDRTKPLPTPKADKGTTARTAPLRLNVLANDGIAPGQSVTVAGFTRPLHGTLTRSGTELLYTPNGSHVGEDSFYYSLRDAEGIVAGATVHIDVRDATPTNLRVTSVTTTSVVLRWDDGSVSETRYVLEHSADGGRTWQHAENVPADRTTATVDGLRPDTEYQFRVRADTSRGLTDPSAPVTARTRAANRPPVAVPDPRAFTRRNTPVRIDVLANDRDPDGDALVAHVENAPRHGSLRRDGNAFVYEPARGYTGQDSFDYYAGDHNGGRSNVVRVRIQVGNVPGPQPVDRHRHTDYNGDGVGDLVFVQKFGTGSGTTEIHVLDGASNFQSFSLHTDTALHVTGAEWEFQAMDFNGDGHLDLVGVKKSGTGSGQVEVHVLNGADNYESWLMQTPTAFAPVGANGRFSLADMNRDGTLDLVLILKSGTGSRSTEVHAFDGRNFGEGHFRRAIVQTGTALHETGSEGDFELGDYNGDGFLDLWYVKKHATGSGRTEVHVFSGADNFRTHLLAVATALHQTGDEAEFELSDFDRDGRLDLYFLKKDLNGANPVEMHVLSAASNFQTFILHVGTGLRGGRDGTFTA